VYPFINQLKLYNISNLNENMKPISLIIIIIIAALLVVFGLRLFSGEDNWICQNGQWVKHGMPSAPMPTTGCGEVKEQPEIIVTNPQANQSVTSPLEIQGQARGSWFFEAVFPVGLINDRGQEIGHTQAHATSDWMTENYVPFTAEIIYEATATSSGWLVFNNDNPSGLPENSKEFKVPVVITPTPALIKVKVYFSNDKLDPLVTCYKVFPVERQIPETQAVARAALEQLLAGPTEQEKVQGYMTSINPGVKIQKLEIIQGVAKVDFDETLERAVGGSCRVTAIRSQITQTLEQFPTVEQEVISIDGRTEDILQP